MKASSSFVGLGLLALALISSVHAGPGAWEASPPLSEVRSLHTATRLGDGKVLVAGGSGGGSVLASSEVYDPTTKTWSLLQSMSQARSSHTATLLGSGSVLLAGGIGFAAPLASTELYTPATETWSTAGSMSQGREFHTATLLKSGLVLVAGGSGMTSDGQKTIESAEIFQPGNNGGIWAPAAPMTQARRDHTAVLLQSGKVLVAGGRAGGALATVEVYDLATNQWNSAAPMSQARYSHTATLLGNGRVLVAGGYGPTGNGGARLTSAEIYDPMTNAWTTTTAPMSQAREKHTATLLADGRVLVTGGYGPMSNGDNSSLASAEIYDPVEGTWIAATSMSEARYSHTATLLGDGKVLVAGGRDINEESFSSVEIYDPNGVPTPTPTVTPTPTTPGTATRPTVTLTGKKKITTTKASVRVKGTATGAVTAVQVKAGKKTVKAAGTTSWSAKVRVKPGVNKLTITATGPGGTSAPAKMTILRR